MQGRITYDSDSDTWKVEGEELDVVYPNVDRKHLNAFVY
jgi:hypothetical protein